MGKHKQKLKKISALIFIWAALLFASVNITYAASITPENVVGLVNQARTEKGLDALAVNEKLNQAASDKAEDMIKNNYFAHNSPKGITPWFWIDKNNYAYIHAGENLAMDFVTAEKEQQAWMKSDGHRNNILNPNYQEIGVAVQKGTVNGRLTTVTVQMFASRKDFTKVGSPTPLVPIEQVATEKILGDEANKIILPGDMASRANVSLEEDIKQQLNIISRRAVESFRYAKETVSRPEFLEKLAEIIYAILLAIVFLINPLAMLFLIGWKISKKVEHWRLLSRQAHSEQ